MSEPDDTPTRLALKGVNHSDDQYHLKQLRAEVSRLQQEHAQLTREWKHAEDRRSDLVVDNRKLFEENALLRRSLKILTNHIDEDQTVNQRAIMARLTEAYEEIEALKRTVYHLMPPRTQPT